MKNHYRALLVLCCSFFLLLTASFPGGAQAQNNEEETEGKTCLTGWLPIQHSQHSGCLQVASCSKETGNGNTDNKNRTLVTESICPANLQEAMASEQNVTGLVNIQKGNVTHSEYILTPSEQSASWFYGWSAVNFGMSVLHIFKATEKAKLLYSNNASNKNVFFFVSYMTGAFHHLLEMPSVMASYTIGLTPHLIAHTGMLILSIIERAKDCTCCSQFKNGHNTMIAFNSLLLGLTAFNALTTLQ